MVLELIILSKVRQSKTNIIWYHLYVEPKYIYLCVNELIYKTSRPIDIRNKLMVSKWEREREG